MKSTEHGSIQLAMKAKCPCGACEATREHRRRAARRYGKMKTRGERSYTDAEPVRRHIQQLLDAGMTRPQIAVAAGLGLGARTVIRNIMVGRPEDGKAPAAGVKHRTARALLAVTPDPCTITPGATVDATGTRRRYQALLAAGWTQRDIASRTGVVNISTCVHRPRVTAHTAAATARVYDELQNRPGPSARGRHAALRKGWLAPGWWDADTIDDPRACPPTEIRTEKGELQFDHAVPHAPQHARLASKGYTPAYIAALTGNPLRYVRRDIIEGRKPRAHQTRGSGLLRVPPRDGAVGPDLPPDPDGVHRRGRRPVGSAA